MFVHERSFKVPPTRRSPLSEWGAGTIPPYPCDCHPVSISSTWLTSLWLHMAQSLLFAIGCSISLSLSSSCRLNSLTSSALASSSSSFCISIFLSSMISDACCLTFSLRWSLICYKKRISDGSPSSTRSVVRDKKTCYYLTLHSRAREARWFINAASMVSPSAQVQHLPYL